MTEWKVVPVEASKEQIAAYIAADPSRRRFTESAKRDYRAMVSAAPDVHRPNATAWDKALEKGMAEYLSGGERRSAQLAFEAGVLVVMRELGMLPAAAPDAG